MQHLEQVPKTGEFIIIYIGQHGVREVSLFISQVNTDRNNDDGCSQLTCSQDITTHPQGESHTGVSATGVLQQGAGDCAEPTRRGSEASSVPWLQVWSPSHSSHCPSTRRGLGHRCKESPALGYRRAVREM